jgi:hypothetical protein
MANLQLFGIGQTRTTHPQQFEYQSASCQDGMDGPPDETADAIASWEQEPE